MAIQNCQSCFRVGDATVSYVATATELTLTLADPCCNFHDCKSIRHILGQAFIALAATDVIDADPSTCNGCDLDANFPTVEWEFGNKVAVIDGNFSTVDPLTGDIEVPV